MDFIGNEQVIGAEKPKQDGSTSRRERRTGQVPSVVAYPSGWYCEAHRTTSPRRID